MPEPRERTPEEREEARLERERRRAQAVPGEVDDMGSLYDPPDRPGEEEAGDPPDRRGQEEDGHAWEEEPAAGTRRVGWRERSAAVAHRDGAGREAPRRAATQGAGREAPHRAAPRPRGPRSLWGRIAAVLGLLVAAAVIWLCVELFQPFHGTGRGSVIVTIPSHTGAHQVGDLLAGDGVVASGFFFYLRAQLAGDGGKLRAGTYRLKRDMSYGDALKVLTTPPPAAKVADVTIVPGKTRVQLNALLRSQGIPGSYLAATRRSPLLDPRAYGAPRGTRSLEGFLYPDTYQLREPITVSALVADQLKAFKHTFAHVNLSYARSRRLSAYDVLIIASIDEKEAATARDRALVASVIYNRLKDHIPLGMDSTTRYEFNDYTKPLTNAQLNTPSPYNTRQHQGLPPTPIANPGLAAIQAAAHPAQTGYLYFVVRPGTCSSVFSSNYNRFLADSARYQQARAAKGGRSPTKC